MRKTTRLLVSGVAVWVACLGFTTQASAAALTEASPEYMGLIVDGIPPSDADDFVNILNDRPLNSGPTLIGTETYTRSGNLLCGATCPDITNSTPLILDETEPIPGFSVGAGTYYVTAKYDQDKAGTLVWYITPTGLTDYTVQQQLNGHDISNLRVYQVDSPDGGPSDVVPEPASLLLLGAGLSAAAVRARRRIATARG